MYKSLLLLLAVILCSCGKTGQQRAEAGEQNSGMANNAPPEKTIVMKRIDEQAALINLLVTTPGEWCRSMNKLEQLSSLANSSEDRDYAEAKANEIKSTLQSRQRTIIDKYWSANYDQKQADAHPQHTIVDQFRAQQKVAEVVSANIIDKKTHYDFDDTQRNTITTYLLTVRQHTGLFSKDLFFSVNASAIAQYNLTCGSKGGIVYSSDIGSITPTQR